MTGLTSYVPHLMVLLSIGAVFVVMFVTVSKILREMSCFGHTTARVLALCAAVLCAVGMAQFLTFSKESHDITGMPASTSLALNYVLLAYVTLSAPILLSQLIASRMPADTNPGVREPSSATPGTAKRPHTEKDDKPMTKTKGRGRPKKQATDGPSATRIEGSERKTTSSRPAPAAGPDAPTKPKTNGMGKPSEQT